jgi:hypothetical protein
MFKDAKDYDAKIIYKRPQAIINLKKINSLPREEKVWLDNLKGRYAGEKNPNYGKKHSAEAKAKIALAHTGRKHSEESKEKRLQTMHDRYGKASLSTPTHTFDSMSLTEFLNNNKSLVLSLIDESNRYKYHKIHALLLEKCTSNTNPSQGYRSVALTTWMKKVKETA